MSTTTYNPLAAMKRSRILPALDSLTPRDFKVCEACGGPAMLHPRFEMAQIVAGDKAILCCACLHEETCPGAQVTRIGDQIWRCLACLKRRAWGQFEPWDSHLRPVLHCGDCNRVTRHRFVGVA